MGSLVWHPVSCCSAGHLPGARTVSRSANFQIANLLSFQALKFWHVQESLRGPSVVEAVTFRYVQESLRGASVVEVGTTELASNAHPIVLINGEFVCQAPAGGVNYVALDTHSMLAAHSVPPVDSPSRPDMVMKSKFQQALKLGQLETCFDLAFDLDDMPTWDALRQEAFEALDVPLALRVARQMRDRGTAFEALDVPLALRVARQMRDCGTVLALQPLLTVEDRNLLSGHFALLLREFSLAQDLLISSTRPLAALEMRCDLRQWDQALRLAETLQPAQIPHICLQYADKLAAEGEYDQALERYTQAQDEHVSAGGRSVQVELSGAHMASCKGGMAKMQIKTGNTTKGMQIAEESGMEGGMAKMQIKTGDTTKGMQIAEESGMEVCFDCGGILEGMKQYSDAALVCFDCGGILEGMKQYSDAALMFEKAEAWERAAGLYIKLKEFRAAAPLMAKISTPSLHVKYAAAKEKQGQHREAAESYEKGKDMDSVVRLCLDNLNTPQRAFQIVRETRYGRVG
ncbi:hypothetical protein T484DRAFT_1770086 [Baffinella frigidus]|nr:hypothetical protein T484DRAFT_1770086 [Cryptophyta sp. CCMP2293]